MKLQDYLHYYLGCRVKATPYGGQSARWEEGKIMGINVHDVAHVKFDTWQSVADVTISCIKPILRRLEDMTEEEMIGMLQSMVPVDMNDKPIDDEYGIEMFYFDNATMVDGDIAVGANYSCRCYEGQIAIKLCGTLCLFDETGKDVTRDELKNAPKAFHYLLKQDFDLFGLIPAGLAIDAKTLQP